MPVVPFDPRSTSPAPPRPTPDPTFVAMAAGQMHSEGRLIGDLPESLRTPSYSRSETNAVSRPTFRVTPEYESALAKGDRATTDRLVSQFTSSHSLNPGDQFNMQFGSKTSDRIIYEIQLDGSRKRLSSHYEVEDVDTTPMN